MRTHHHSDEWKVYRIVMAGILVGAFVGWAIQQLATEDRQSHCPFGPAYAMQGDVDRDDDFAELTVGVLLCA